MKGKLARSVTVAVVMAGALGIGTITANAQSVDKYTISGVLETSNGTPMGNVPFNYGLSADGGFDFSGTTNPNGTFSTKPLTMGEYELRFGVGNDLVDNPVVTVANQNVKMGILHTLHAHYYAITGQLLTNSGSPFWFGFVIANENNQQEYYATAGIQTVPNSQEQDEYYLPYVPNGTYTVAFYNSAYTIASPFQIVVSGANQKVDIRLANSVYSVTGTLLDAGVPISNSGLSIVPPNGGMDGYGWSTDSAGNFSIPDLPDGSYSLEVQGHTIPFTISGHDTNLGVFDINPGSSGGQSSLSGDGPQWHGTTPGGSTIPVGSKMVLAFPNYETPMPNSIQVHFYVTPPPGQPIQQYLNVVTAVYGDGDEASATSDSVQSGYTEYTLTAPSSLSGLSGISMYASPPNGGWVGYGQYAFVSPEADILPEVPFAALLPFGLAVAGGTVWIRRRRNH